jgi:hypothetical protein
MGVGSCSNHPPAENKGPSAYHAAMGLLIEIRLQPLMRLPLVSWNQNSFKKSSLRSPSFSRKRESRRF